MSLAPAARDGRAARAARAGGPWLPAAGRLHGRSATALLAGAALLALAAPAASGALSAHAGALLLVGGALIGVPHGASDFVVAHRLLRPALGRGAWLPAFLAAYLALVALVMTGWALAPLATLLAFVLASGLHFGLSDAGAAPAPGWLAARGSTPLLPILLAHPAGVAPFVAALGGVGEQAALGALLALRWPLLLAWAALVAGAALPRLGRGGGAAAGAAELLALAFAALALPPLAGFALYFCLVHAPRHMLEIAGAAHPRRPAAAARLAGAVLAPSALVCLAALSLCWDGLSGAAGTDAAVAWGLRIVAALTAPHMALEWLASPRHRRGGGDAAISARRALRPGDGRSCGMAELVWDSPAVARWSPEMTSEQIGNAGRNAQSRSFPDLRAALNFVIEELEATPRMNVGVYPERGSALINLAMVEQAYRSRPAPGGEPAGAV